MVMFMLRVLLVLSLLAVLLFDVYMLKGDVIVGLYCKLDTACIDHLVFNNQTARGLIRELNKQYGYFPKRFVFVYHPSPLLFSFLKKHIYGTDSPELVAMTVEDLGIIITSSEKPRILKHELTHLWFHSGIKWLDEGVAEYIALGPGPCIDENPEKYSGSAFYDAAWKKVSCYTNVTFSPK